VTAAADVVVRLSDVSVRRGRTRLVGPVDWTIRRGERWIVVGPNGAGKTTLLEIVGTTLWPSTGSVEVLGSRIGRVDARELRTRIGTAGSALERAVPADLAAHDVVMTAKHAALAPWWHAWSGEDHERADGLLERFRLTEIRDRAFGVLSSGERRRVMIARALMPDPDLLLLDEPASSLDLAARETLVHDLSVLARDGRPDAIVLVTHHLEEVPLGFDCALVLSHAAVVAAGPTEVALTGETLTRAYGLPITVDRSGGRFFARAIAASAPGAAR
jgi:iron complex transport system ATP-binding protein